jgi:hypothetical protein
LDAAERSIGTSRDLLSSLLFLSLLLSFCPRQQRFHLSKSRTKHEIETPAAAKRTKLQLDARAATNEALKARLAGAKGGGGDEKDAARGNGGGDDEMTSPDR